MINELNLHWYMTRGINEELKNSEQFHKDFIKAIEQFNNDDWGIVPQEDKEANDQELKNRCGRVVARYHTCAEDIYIILDGDFETTTVLFCSEY